MDPVVVDTVAGAGNISLWHLVVQASWPVFLVMLGLGLASVWSWAIIIEKFLNVRRMNAANDRFEQFFWSGQSLEDLYQSLGSRTNIGLAAIFMAPVSHTFSRPVNSGLNPVPNSRIESTLPRTSKCPSVA